MSLPTRMLGIEITAPGGPAVLRAASLAVPPAGPGEVLVQVAAAGVNRPDCLQRAGLYAPPPSASPLPGLEIAGVVVAVGEGTPRWEVGARVVALTHGGGYAEFCAAHGSHCLPWPAGWSPAEAAGLPETCFTVEHNLFARAQLKANDTVLIHGGSSGIGATAIQLAGACGARVLTTVGSEEKRDFCLSLGADLAINYRTQDWFEAVMAATDKRGVEVILDMVAGPYVDKNLRALAPDGRYAMIAFLLGAKVEVNFGQVLSKRLTLTGSTLRPQSSAQKAAIARAVEAHVWPLIAAGAYRTPVFKTFPLGEAAAAHTLMEASTHRGKIVLLT
ncbi:MAG: NAD(P)H-quinone oxidoreductase [Gammaproteobacteria bacterium]|nr:NAD(P)H-quinone oxidoreductase [Gammaproteobacteria bacterium]